MGKLQSVEKVAGVEDEKTAQCQTCRFYISLAFIIALLWPIVLRKRPQAWIGSKEG